MPEKERTLLGDVGNVWARRKEIWRLISRADKLGFISGVLIMSLAAAIETGIAILIARFFNRVSKFVGRPASEWIGYVMVALGILAGAYVLKESLNLLRRWILTRTTTRIERNMTVRLLYAAMASMRRSRSRSEQPRRSAAPFSVTTTPASLRGVETGPDSFSTIREAGSRISDTPRGDWLAARMKSSAPPTAPT